jgi:hypothetical protein
MNCSMRDRDFASLRLCGSILLISLLAGCATTADIDSAKTTWHGATYDQVVSRWGTPVRQTTLSDGAQVYTWITEGGGGGFPGSVGVFGGSGGGGGGVGVGIGLPLPGMGGGGELQRCERTLTFRGGRVVEQLWQGQPRLCSTLGRQ